MIVRNAVEGTEGSMSCDHPIRSVFVLSLFDVLSAILTGGGDHISESEREHDDADHPERVKGRNRKDRRAVLMDNTASMAPPDTLVR